MIFYVETYPPKNSYKQKLGGGNFIIEKYGRHHFNQTIKSFQPTKVQMGKNIE